MSDGLKRAGDAAKATRKGVCPVCEKTVTLLLVSGRVSHHGPRSSPCAGSGEFPKEG